MFLPATQRLTFCRIEALPNPAVYRDLKPENVFIDNSGYVKLGDFGFAKVWYLELPRLAFSPIKRLPH